MEPEGTPPSSNNSSPAPALAQQDGENDGQGEELANGPVTFTPPSSFRQPGNPQHNGINDGNPQHNGINEGNPQHNGINEGNPQHNGINEEPEIIWLNDDGEEVYHWEDWGQLVFPPHNRRGGIFRGPNGRYCDHDGNILRKHCAVFYVFFF